jgi:DNA-binding NarL/FixJ family response regulator
MADPSTASPITVVLADDDDRFRTLVAGVLEADGFPVLAEANDARSALTATREHRPDVVILDLVMEGSEGLSTLREILSDDPHQSVLVISSLFDFAIEQEVVSLGAWYLEKAEGLEALEHQLQSITSITRPRR